MPRAVDISNVEKSFVLEALTGSHLRLDGRPLDQFRDIKLLFGAQLGSVIVSIGKTRYEKSSKRDNIQDDLTTR